MRFLLYITLLAASLPLALTCQAQNILTPPFGLRWGDSPEKLVVWGERHAMDLNISLPGDQPHLRILKIQPKHGSIPNSKARSIEARFLDGQLFEVTVHFGQPGEPADAVETQFSTLRRELTREWGALTANQQERSEQDQFATRKLSFHREPIQGLFLLLAYSEITDLLRKKREATFSLLYRNDNLRQQLERHLKNPEKKTDDRR